MRLCSAFVALAGLAGSASASTVTLTIVDATGRPLPNAVVSLKPPGFKGGPQFSYPTSIGQRDIQFAPRLAIVPVGTRLSFPNFDKVRHHVYSFSAAKKFELKLYGRDDTRSVVLDKPGTVALGCNIHDQMSGFIRVVDAPFAAVTNSAGKVVFANVPNGAAQVIVWHQRVRARDNEVRAAYPVTGAISAQTFRVQAI